MGCETKLEQSLTCNVWGGGVDHTIDLTYDRVTMVLQNVKLFKISQMFFFCTV